jgi:hypothetical protein
MKFVNIPQYYNILQLKLTTTLFVESAVETSNALVHYGFHQGLTAEFVPDRLVPSTDSVILLALGGYSNEGNPR